MTKHQERKGKIRKESIKRTEAIFKSKLSVGNMIKAINIWAMISYSARLVKWKKSKLHNIHHKTRGGYSKLLTGL